MKLVALLAGLAVFCAVAATRSPAHRTGYYAKAKRIIDATFPDTTQDAALRVVGCETGHTYKPWAKNPSSGALGYFQFIPGNHGRIINWGSKTMKVNYHRMWQPWYAARAGLILSQGGTNWGEWSCQP